MRKFLLMPLILFLVVAVSWIGNIVKFSDCNFQAPYRCEAIHGLGIIPLAAPITVWFATDKEAGSSQ